MHVWKIKSVRQQNIQNFSRLTKGRLYTIKLMLDNPCNILDVLEFCHDYLRRVSSGILSETYEFFLPILTTFFQSSNILIFFNFVWHSCIAGFLWIHLKLFSENCNENIVFLLWFLIGKIWELKENILSIFAGMKRACIVDAHLC